MSGERAVRVPGQLFERDIEASYEGAPCGLLSTAPDGVILRANRTFVELTGYTHEEIIGRRFSGLLTAGGRIYHETHLAPMLQMHGKAKEIALEIQGADGRRVPVLVNAVVDNDAEEAQGLTHVAVFEASARREYERELLSAKQRAETSESRARALALTLQQTLVPPDPPEIDGLEISVAYRPAGDGEEIGGDFYDVFELGPDDWAIAIGDVCGKGTGAAVVTALARHTLRAAAVRSHRPSAVLDTLNQVLLRDESERFCTVTFLRLRHDDQGWTFTTSSAGHPLPLLVRPGERAVPVGEHGLLLGFLQETILSDTELRLHPGDAIVLHTDGVTDARRSGSSFGEERLKDSLFENNGRSDSLAEATLVDVLAFQDGVPRDDIAIVAVVVSG